MPGSPLARIIAITVDSSMSEQIRAQPMDERAVITAIYTIVAEIIAGLYSEVAIRFCFSTKVTGLLDTRQRDDIRTTMSRDNTHLWCL